MKVHRVELGEMARLASGVEIWQAPYPARVRVDLFYPRTDSGVKIIEIGLCDVRAADNIRVTYDFERDGYLIEQSDHAQLESWIEVAFVPAWGQELPKPTDG